MQEHQILGVDAGLMSLFLMPVDRTAPEWNSKYGTNFGLGIITPVRPGRKIVMNTAYSDEGVWGDRVKEVEFIVTNTKEPREITAGNNQVAVLSDPCYILSTGRENGGTGLSDAYKALLEQMHLGTSRYPEEIEHEWLLNYNNCSGLICSSGFGDGRYHACVETDDEGFFIRAYVVFIEEEDDEEYVAREGHDIPTSDIALTLSRMLAALKKE